MKLTTPVAIVLAAVILAAAAVIIALVIPVQPWTTPHSGTGRYANVTSGLVLDTATSTYHLCKLPADWAYGESGSYQCVPSQVQP